MEPIAEVALIFAFSIALLFYFAMMHPLIRIGKIEAESYSIISAIGPVILYGLGLIGVQDILSSIVGTKSSPLGILALFLSMVFISICLDLAGVMEFCAKMALKYSGDDARKLFLSFYWLVSFLTIFTSNDIIILTLTPFIYYFAKHADLDPVPFLIAEFFAANTWSMMLYIGNPTNIFIASSFSIGFFQYFSKMVLPTLAAGSVCLALLYVIFRKSISKKMIPAKVDPYESLKDRAGAAIGVALLAAAIISVALAPGYGVPVWIPSAVFCVLLGIILILRDRSRKESDFRLALARMPWGVIPFLLGFFIMSGALEKYGLTIAAHNAIAYLSKDSPASGIFAYGLLSAAASNLLNNIPMSLVFSSILSNLGEEYLLGPSLAVVIGSNIGANFTPMGALAGIMWMSILRHKGVRIDFVSFSRYGLMVNLASLFAALAVLSFVV